MAAVAAARRCWLNGPAVHIDTALQRFPRLDEQIPARGLADDLSGLGHERSADVLARGSLELHHEGTVDEEAIAARADAGAELDHAEPNGLGCPLRSKT